MASLTARGSGWRIDVRHDSPCEVYDEISWEVVTDDSKDIIITDYGSP